MECVLWIRENSGSKEKSESNQHVAITKAIYSFADLGTHAGLRSICGPGVFAGRSPMIYIGKFRKNGTLNRPSRLPHYL